MAMCDIIGHIIVTRKREELSNEEYSALPRCPCTWRDCAYYWLIDVHHQHPRHSSYSPSYRGGGWSNLSHRWHCRDVRHAPVRRPDRKDRIQQLCRTAWFILPMGEGLRTAQPVACPINSAAATNQRARAWGRRRRAMALCVSCETASIAVARLSPSSQASERPGPATSRLQRWGSS